MAELQTNGIMIGLIGNLTHRVLLFRNSAYILSESATQSIEYTKSAIRPNVQGSKIYIYLIIGQIMIDDKLHKPKN